MKNEFLIAITQLSAEKNLPKEIVFEAIEAALVSAYKKDNLVGSQNIAVKITPNTGEVKVYAQKTVVEEPTDPKLEISLPDAIKLNKQAQLGDVVGIEVTPFNSGRIAAQTAKQVVLQRLREAEREAIFTEYAGKEGDIVSGIIQHIEPRQIIVDIGKTEAVLPLAEQVRTEHYRVGQRLKVYLVEVSRSNKGPQVIVSRTHRNLLRRLFEMEVPEIYNGIVEIKAVAREAGHRGKVAVWARQDGVDPVGSCVGMRGIRIQNIVNELGGERVDVVLWDPSQEKFIANALSPAQVTSVEIEDAEKTANVVVPDRQLSLAIGKEGQNVRLAAKLSGWRIDIKSASTAEAEREHKEAEAAAALAERLAAEKESPFAPAAAEIEPVAATGEPVAAETAIVAEESPAIEEHEEVAALPAVARQEAKETKPAEPAVEWTQPEPALPKPQIRFAEEVLPASAERDERKAAKKGKKRGPGEEEEEVRAAPVAKAKKGHKARVVYEEEEEDDYSYLVNKR
ncbi:MAG: transcription termination/antitermination protein NusA [Chloroflexi bacterium]|nr:transcription termination/antitermination protein NusA [Chloroflexota bacterium]